MKRILIFKLDKNLTLIAGVFVTSQAQNGEKMLRKRYQFTYNSARERYIRYRF